LGACLLALGAARPFAQQAPPRLGLELQDYVTYLRTLRTKT
jgi:hypothetical protein